MALTIQKETENLLVLSVSGLFTKSDHDQWKEEAIKTIQASGNMKALILSPNFQGWAKSDAWEGVTFVGTFGEKIEKIAFVGDPKWRDEIFMFAGKGIRSTQIEFFETSNEVEARNWLQAS